MTGPVSFEVEEAEGADLGALSLAGTQRACEQCGGPSWTGRVCTACTYGGTGVPAPPGASFAFGWPERQAGRPAAERTPYPAPERSSRDRMPEGGVTYPPAFLTLVRDAEAWEWACLLQAARGWKQHSTRGVPLKVVDSYAVRMHRGQYRAVAVHTGGAWSSVWIWGPDLPLFGHCGVTELRMWLCGPVEQPMPASWYAELRAKRQEQAAGAKAAAKARPKKAKGEGL